MNDQAFELLKSDIIHLRSEIKALRNELNTVEHKIEQKLDVLLEFRWRIAGVLSVLTVVGAFVARIVI